MNNLRDRVVIIGGGVAGLAAGCLLARNGLAVQLFETNSKIGGCCATTTVDGYTFNDGAVFLGMINLLDHAFARIGLNRGELLPLRKITAHSSTTLPDGTVVTLGEGFDLTVSGAGGVAQDCGEVAARSPFCQRRAANGPVFLLADAAQRLEVYNRAPERAGLTA